MSIYGHILPGATKIAKIPLGLSKKARIRLGWFDWYFSHGMNARLTCRHFGISPDTFYRWKARYNPKNLLSLEDRSRRPHSLRKPDTPLEVIERVRKLRETYPRWSKYKIGTLLRREGYVISDSTVGRILKRLRDRGILIEPRLPKCAKAKVIKTRRKELRKPKDYMPIFPGDLVQVDTLTVRVAVNTYRKQFTARDVISKIDVLEAYSRATSNIASKFLDSIQIRFPFPVRAIQVDGGSEFMGEFETECQRRGIRLFVLPPKSPRLNGCVERAHRTHEEEFYQVYEIPLVLEEHNELLREWEDIYNNVRPHQALNYLTPMEYYQLHLQLQKEQEVKVERVYGMY